MTMKVTLQFLGTGSAFTLKNYQTNAVLTVTDESGKHRMLIDAGTDVRRSLADCGVKATDLESVYISHLHSDHAGGLPDLALMNFFAKQNLGEVMKSGGITNDSVKPTLFGVGTLLDEGWSKCWSAPLETLEIMQAKLSDYFNVHPIPRKNAKFNVGALDLQAFQTVHVMNALYVQDSYGLIFTVNGTKIMHTTDTQFAPHQLMSLYRWSDVILHDCETSKFKSGVHAHYTDLLTLPAEIKAKMWLFHYQDGELPDAKKDGFQGFIEKGQIFEWA